VNLPYDPLDPPEKPPPGTDRLMWTVAYQLRLDHVPAPDGFCSAPRCRPRFKLWPCEPVRLSDAGLLGSVGWWTARTGPHEPGPNSVTM
jgi:hypothetical protein